METTQTLQSPQDTEPKKEKKRPALKLPRPQLDGALRISFSCDTTREDVDALIKGLRAAKEQLFPTLS